MSESYLVVELNHQPVELCKLLKIADLVGGGGEAKIVISEGYVLLNGEVEYQKRKKVYQDDIIEFNGESVEVLDADNFDWSLAQIGFFSAGGNISAQFAPIAADAGCIVIDNTSEFRYDADIPLVVPEVNPHALAEYRNRNIIANPNCSTIQMMVALKPIYDAVGISRVNVSTYQSVSGGGKDAMDELAKQTAALLSGKPVESKNFPRQIAFNVIPQIDVFLENGYTKEEMKMVWETQKILGDDLSLIHI